MTKMETQNSILHWFFYSCFYCLLKLVEYKTSHSVLPQIFNTHSSEDCHNDWEQFMSAQVLEAPGWNIWVINIILPSHFSRVRLCVTPQTAAHQAPPSLGFSRQEHFSGLPFPCPMQKSEKWKWSRSVVSDPQRPHGLQPSRLLRPWDFPGKSTGVGCHCLLRTSSYKHSKSLQLPRLGNKTLPNKNCL